jgi:ferric-dicitrate binding protein FerR (iron transport regulator)
METENNHMDPVGLLPKYFAGEANPEEKRVIDLWLSADEKNRAEFEAFLKLWNLTGKAQPSDEINLDAEWKRMDQEISTTKIRKISLLRVIQIAASVILVCTLGFAGLKFAGTRSEKAPVTELSTVKMPDGTVISLNAGSKITYQKGYGVSHRNVALKGEAFFEVAKNDHLPFIISAGEARIKVTGTKFNVRAYKGQSEVRVTVTEGTVRLYETGQSTKEAVLTAGETGTFNRSMRVVKKQPVLNMNDIAWKTRIMDFHNTTLSEVASVLENTYHRKVWVDPSVRLCPLTVRFENQELTPVLNVLRSTLDLTITLEGNEIMIKGDGC